MRFFTKAVETYEAGLHKFPHSFNLAYNKSVTFLHYSVGSELHTDDIFPERGYNTRLRYTLCLSGKLSFRCCTCLR